MIILQLSIPPHKEGAAQEEEEIQCLKSFEITTEILSPGKTLNPNARGGGGGGAVRGFVGSFCCWLWSKSVAAISGVIARRRELDCAPSEGYPTPTKDYPILAHTTTTEEEKAEEAKEQP
jgi:hypothetical protein